MTDLTNHNWHNAEFNDCDENEITLLNGSNGVVSLNKDDSTAIAKHFHDLMNTKERLAFWNVMFKDKSND